MARDGAGVRCIEADSVQVALRTFSVAEGGGGSGHILVSDRNSITSHWA